MGPTKPKFRPIDSLRSGCLDFIFLEKETRWDIDNLVDH